MTRGILVLLGLATLVASLPARAETVGERFRRSMEAIRQDCIAQPPERRDARCRILEVQPFDPLATPEGRFAHQIQLPAQLVRKVSYREGVSADAYFRELCEKDAGMFILRTVQDVPGVLQMRPRQLATQDMFEHLHGMEDPYGHTRSESDRPEAFFLNPVGPAYQYFEVLSATRRPKPPEAGSFAILTGYKFYSDKAGTVFRSPAAAEFREARTSRYAYTWRGIGSNMDRELGIAGGEILVLDVESGELLALLRGYVRTGNVRNRTGVYWEFGPTCPFLNIRKRAKDVDLIAWFVSQVVKPAPLRTSDGEPDAGK
jgi:hypothetical protein